MMELDEIKKAWSDLDNRLAQNEGLNQRLIKEMLLQKSSKSLSKLFNYEIFGVIVTLLLLPLLIHAVPLFKSTSIIHVIIIYFALGIAALSLISQLYSTALVRKIDLQKGIKENLSIVQRYKIYTKKVTIASIVITSFYLCLCIFALSLQKVEAWLWAFTIILIFGVFPLLVYWQYTKVYMTNIKSIQDSLEELKDLEE